MKAIPVSIVIVSMVLPIWLSTNRNTKRSLRILQMGMLFAAFIWALLCVYVYPQYVLLE